MGCDIHIFLERKNSENRWKDSMVYGNKYGDKIEPLSSYNRDYTLFATLAGVRGDEPIEFPKGIPENCTTEYKKMCDEWGYDGHSHSYFTLRELLDASVNCPEPRKHSLNAFVLHLKDIIKMVDMWVSDGDIEKEAERYRVCFFFDN